MASLDSFFLHVTHPCSICHIAWLENTSNIKETLIPMFGHFFLMFLHVPHLSSTFSTVGTLDGFKQIWRLCICILWEHLISRVTTSRGWVNSNTSTVHTADGHRTDADEKLQNMRRKGGRARHDAREAPRLRPSSIGVNLLWGWVSTLKGNYCQIIAGVGGRAGTEVRADDESIWG